MADIEVERDYARKQYRTNKAYPEFVRTVTQKSIWDQVTNKTSHLAEFSGIEFDSRDPLVKAYEKFLRQSEFKKPYRSDSYQDMEQDLFPQDPYRPTSDVIDPFDPHPVFIDDPPGGGSALFDLNVSGGWCEDKTETIICTTSQPCYFIQITYMSSGGVTINGATSVVIPGLNSFELQLFVPDGYSGMVTLEAIMVTFDGISGDSNDNVFESRLCCECDTNPYQWSPGNPSTIGAPDSVVIEVEGSCSGGQWGWEFTNDAGDNGFSFGSINTSIPLNTLITTSGACGSAIIKVTDIDGCEVIGSVRCTASGEWVLQSSCSPCRNMNSCGLPGSPDTSSLFAPSIWLFEKTSGHQKQVNRAFFGCGAGTGGGIPTEEECEERIENFPWSQRCGSTSPPCSAINCRSADNYGECLTHPPTMSSGDCVSAAVVTDCHKVNPSWYPGGCVYGVVGPYWSGAGIVPFCEYNQKYYEWECP